MACGPAGHDRGTRIATAAAHASGSHGTPNVAPRGNGHSMVDPLPASREQPHGDQLGCRPVMVTGATTRAVRRPPLSARTASGGRFVSPFSTALFGGHHLLFEHSWLGPEGAAANADRGRFQPPDGSAAPLRHGAHGLAAVQRAQLTPAVVPPAPLVQLRLTRPRSAVGAAAARLVVQLAGDQRVDSLRSHSVYSTLDRG